MCEFFDDVKSFRNKYNTLTSDQLHSMIFDCLSLINEQEKLFESINSESKVRPKKETKIVRPENKKKKGKVGRPKKIEAVNNDKAFV